MSLFDANDDTRFSLRVLLCWTLIAAICSLPLYYLGPWGATLSVWLIFLSLIAFRRQFAVAAFLLIVSLPWMLILLSVVME
jgi:hypothetical protein